MTIALAMCSASDPSVSQSETMLSNGGSPSHMGKSAVHSTMRRWVKDETQVPSNPTTLVTDSDEPQARTAWDPGETELPDSPEDITSPRLLITEISDREIIANQTDEQPTCKCPRHDEDFVFVNLRGIRFAVCRSHLNRKPKSRLALLSKSDKNFSYCDDEYYFDRNPMVFNSLLDFYSQGEMHLPTNVCIQSFRCELEYWRLEPELLAPCCWSKYRKAEEEERTLVRVKKEWGTFGARIYTDYDEHGNKVSTMQRIWIFLNEPQTSFAAKLWSVFMILMIGISIAVLSLETMVEMREGPDWFWESLANITEKRLVYMLEHSEPHVALVWVEFVTLVVLTAEFFMRLVTCPSKREFCKSVLNIADVIGIMPIWIMISLYFSETKIQGTEKGAIVFAYYFMMCMRLLRIFRLFKLVKHYKTLKILLLAVKASYRELLLLVILLTMGVIIYANLVYFVEVEHDNFMSIPEGFWWAIVTMTTVGYGDYYPKSGLGYVVGSFCAITGILVIALPVPVIANNFSTYYSSALAWERMSSKDMPLEDDHSSSGSPKLDPHRKNIDEAEPLQTKCIEDIV